MDLEITVQRSLVSKIFAFAYLANFASNYGQIAGLWGNDGILPAEQLINQSPLAYFAWIVQGLSQLFPSLLEYSVTDTLLYLVTFIGFSLSLLSICFGFMENSFTFVVLWMCHYSFFTIGNTFLAFQWDTLLLEVGFLAIFYVKLPFSSGVFQSHIYARELLRWLFFRFSFGSGIVKLLSNCPTWWSLTAMQYYYETQCLPSPFSWYFHNLPQEFQKLSVAFTYFALIFAPFLAFVPVRSLRIFLGLVQITLQTLIMLTGNYNFFNILCIGL